MIVRAITFGCLWGAAADAGLVSFTNNTPFTIGLGYESWCGVWPARTLHTGPVTKIAPGERIGRHHPLCSFSNIVIIVEKDGKDETIYHHVGNANNVIGRVIFDSPSGQFIKIMNLQ
jgi:hypothetical protein